MIDEQRQANGLEIPENIMIIGIMDPNKPNAYDGEDFFSRFHTKTVFTGADLPEVPMVFEQLTAEHENPIQINLEYSDNWKNMLFGSWAFTQNNLSFIEGPLNHQTLASGCPIIIQNPPQDPEFELFWLQAKLHGKTNIRGITYHVPPNIQLYSYHGYDFTELNKSICPPQGFDSNTHVLNKQTLNSFLKQFKFNEQRSFECMPGLIAEHARNKPNTPMGVLLTEDLSNDEMGVFLTEAQKHNVKIYSYSLKISDLHELTAYSLETKSLCIVSHDPDYTIAFLNQHNDYYVFDISECSITSLTVKINIQLNNDLLSCTEETQDLLNALNQNKKVILTGEFTQELLNRLAVFIMQRANTDEMQGNLILINNQAIPYMPCVLHNFGAQEIYDTLQQQGFSPQELSALQQEQDNILLEESFVRLLTRLRYKRKYPDRLSLHAWHGLDKLTIDNTIEPFNLAKSQEDSCEFIGKRIHDLYLALTDEPYVFLSGLTGVGKSCMVERELKNCTIFHGEESILSWTQADASTNPILFLDEANLSYRKWSEFEGLFANSPYVFINGQYSQVSTNHKIIFAGNPLSYGDERTLSPLFTRHGNSLVFTPLTPAFIYENTLKPLLENYFHFEQIQIITEEFFAIYEFLINKSTDEVLISPRQIQMMALLFIDYYSRYNDIDLQTIAKFAARNIALHLIPKQHITEFNAKFHEVTIARPPIHLNMYMTEAMQKISHQVDDFLQVRKLPFISENSLKRFVIEGEPGVGKSDLLYKLMLNNNILELRLNDPIPMDVDIFYRLLPSMSYSVQEQILLNAFDYGAIVLIDEINSIPTLEKLLNSLLDGKHPHENNRPPLCPGFRVFGTQNPPTMCGRRIESNALKNRTILMRLPNYSKPEMYALLDYIGMPCDLQQEFVAAFSKQVANAKAQHLKPAPTFRDFIRRAKEIATIYNARRGMKRNANFLFENSTSRQEDSTNMISYNI